MMPLRIKAEASQSDMQSECVPCRQVPRRGTERPQSHFLGMGTRMVLAVGMGNWCLAGVCNITQAIKSMKESAAASRTRWPFICFLASFLIPERLSKIFKDLCLTGKMTDLMRARQWRF